MERSRTVKTLVALVAAMTAGTFALLMLQTEPIPSPIKDLATVVAPEREVPSAVYGTEGPVHSDTWRNVVVHFAPEGDARAAGQYHFLLAPGPKGRCEVRATDLWKRQQPGLALRAPGNWNSRSVGVCLVGDYAGGNPGREQFRNLVALVQTLQQLCGISADHVYLASEVDRTCEPMGETFRLAFSRHLLRM